MSNQPTTTKSADNAAENQQQQPQSRLWVTHVSAVGPYLRICGQLNPMTDLPKLIEERLLPLCKGVYNSLSIEEKMNYLSMDATYLVKTVNRITLLGDTELLRARILRFIETQPPQSVLLVEVDFIDMGFTKIIESDELLIAPKGDKLITMPPLGSQFIMLGIFGDWSKVELESVLRLIAHQDLMITVDMELQGHKFIKMKWKDWDFGEFLVSQRKIGAPINKDFQKENFLRLLKDQEKHSKGSTTTTSYNENNNTSNRNNNTIASSQNGNGKLCDLHAANSKALNLGNANMLRKQLLEREKQLAEQLQQQQTNLYYKYLQHPQAFQNIVMPNQPMVPRLPPNIGNNFQNYMLGIQQHNNRLPINAVYGLPGITQPTPYAIPYQRRQLMEVTPAPAPTALRVQRPLVLPVETNVAKSNNTYNNKAVGKSLPNTGFKINKFVIGNTYDVCVSFVEKGPSHFSVQLNDSQSKLTDMMNAIEQIPLKNLKNEPTVGMACIARYSEDGHMYRAMVVSVQQKNIQVIYIDYGNSEFVKKNDLYEIPAQFLDERAFALPFSLAGLKALGPIDDSLKKTFKEMVVYQMCKLKVTSPEGPPVVQYCELYLQQKDMLKVLQDIQKSRSVYPKAAQLCSNDTVEIRFIDSPRNFYVQKVSNIDEFNKLMDDMDKYYNMNQVVPLCVVVGAAYAVKNDSEWYRAEVIRSDEMAIIVRFIDFGYERIVTKNLLSNISEKHLKMPRQAVHCCLKGFESNELGNKDIATTQFEMLAEESQGRRRSFTVKVFRIHIDDLHIVNLFTKELNVMKKLYKLSMPFEQYLSLEKSDFHINGYGGGGGNKSKSKEENTKTYSTNSSNIGDDHSSQLGKKNIKSNEVSLKAAPLAPLLPQNQQQSVQAKQQQNQLQSLNKQQKHQEFQQQNLLKQQLSPKSTPALRLQQYSNKNQNKNGGDCDNNSSASSNMSKHHKQQRGSDGSKQQQQSHGRKTQHQDVLNNSFESTDRRSDASTNSNRSRNNNSARQKDRRHNKDADISRSSTVRSVKKPSQQLERSQNAPQGYSQSRRGSMDSQYGAVVNDTQQISPILNTAAAAVATLSSKQTEEYVSLDYKFPIEPIKTPTTENVTICWWISPHQFYTHHKKRAADFEELMREIQKFYHKKPLQQLQLKPGSNVIARHRKDRMYYRASIIACNPMLRKYKVYFIDFGNQYTVTSEDIWQVERRFADFPVMAYCCSFQNIVSNYDHLYIIDRMEKYLPNGAILSCEYKEANQNVYYVNVKLNNSSLLERLKNDKIVTEISPDFNLELLAGQQIRAKIISVKNMLNFKIIFEGCDVPLLCSYDDVRYVKSKPDIGQRFKIHYEGKSVVVNIKSVNTHKVILLRPLIELFRDDIPSYICCNPRILQTFKGRLVFIASLYRIYLHDKAANEKVNKLLDAMFEYYENQGLPLTSFGNDQICAVKLADKNWYRARIIPMNDIKNNNIPRNSSNIKLYLLDYGYTEIVEKSELKVLEPQFFIEQNALAIEVNLPIMMTDKKSNANDLNAAALKELRLMLEGQELTVKALECRRNHLIGEVINEKGENIVDRMISQKLVKSRDFDYIFKHLDKDKTSMLEFIETVDLTLEEEELQTPKEIMRNSEKNNNNTMQQKEELVFNDNDLAATNVEEVKNQQLETNEQIVTKTIEKVIEPTAEKVEEFIHAVEPKEETISVSSPVPPATPADYSDIMEQAVLSHCDTPAQFFIHAYDKIEQLHKLQENLQIVASSLPPLMNVYNGAHCISLYSVDKQWYRAEIIDAELMVLKFIDFGNTDCVSDTTDIKEMSVFPDIEPLCIPCALPIQPNGTADWVDAANAIFNESYEKILYYTYILQSDNNTPKKPNYINLIIDNVNVAKKLIDDGFAKPLEWVETGENCYISHVNSISDFYIQYEKDSKALELIEFHLENFEQFPKLTNFIKHKIVAALFHDDEKWYRAKLLRDMSTNPDGSESVGGYEVLFVDYGNTAVTHECREISKELANLPILSKKCALALDTKIYFGWSDDAEIKFAEIASCGDTIFNVELRAPSAEHAIVQLYVDTLNINSELEPLCMQRCLPIAKDCKNIELALNSSFGTQSSVTTIDPNDITKLHNVVISQFNGPESFYVQFEKDSARLEDLVTTLNACVGMDIAKHPYELGKMYAAVFEDDQQLYRAKLLSINDTDDATFLVHFVDYGNEAVVKELRILPFDLEQIKEIAKHCTLNKLEELLELGEQAVESFNDIINGNGNDGVVKLEFATQTTPQSINEQLKVNLYILDTEENILEKVKALEIACNPQVCLIPHYVSPFEFYVQPQSEISKMEKITQTLAKANVIANMPKVAMVPALNQIYAVFAEEDDLYYRGLVISKSETAPNAYDVHLIDYGNIIIVSELRELPIELKNEPAIAKLCKLADINDESANGNDETLMLTITEHFATLMDAHFGECFEVEFLNLKQALKAKPAVKLKINGEDVSSKLNEALKTGEAPKLEVQPILHDCAIVQVNNTSSFYIQLLEETREIEAITEALLDAEIEFPTFNQLQVGALCAAKFPDDGVFYRARIIDIIENSNETPRKCLVHFIDFGNDSITNDFRTLPESLCKQRRFSKHCSLDIKFKAMEDAATQHFQSYIDEHYSETFQVEFIKENIADNASNDLTPTSILCRLFNQTKNVASEIEKMLKEQ